MKKFIFLILFIISFTASAQIQGVIVSDTGNITVVKVWGNHYERGYAYAYLMADEIKDVYENYIIPAFGSYLPMAKLLLSVDDHLRIDSIYRSEAQGMIQGITDAAVIMSGVDYLDILVANTFLDLENISAKFPGMNMRNACSSLISWGTATQGTSLNGNSILTRHMDWSNDMTLIENQVLVVHFPSDSGEQPWLLIGFAGQMSVLSGLNDSGVGVMQHMLSDVNASGSMNMGYEPIWFSMRSMIENSDLNQDTENNVQDVKFAINGNTSGYADSYIITSVASASGNVDSSIVLIAEVSPVVPYISFRDVTYPDSIPGDNMYAANYSIVRNNAMHFCTRYDSVRYNMGAGTGIDAEEQWRIMREYSSSCAFNTYGNIQFMQYIPEQRILKLAVHQNNGTQACEVDSMVFDLDDLFQMPAVGIYENSEPRLQVYPNPSKNYIQCKVPDLEFSELYVYDLQAVKYPIYSFMLTRDGIMLNISHLSPGIYILELRGEKILQKRFIKE